MKALTVIVYMEDAAFDEAPGKEAARILRKAADRIEQGETDGKLLDANGNTVGRFTIGGHPR